MNHEQTMNLHEPSTITMAYTKVLPFSPHPNQPAFNRRAKIFSPGFMMELSFHYLSSMNTIHLHLAELLVAPPSFLLGVLWRVAGSIVGSIRNMQCKRRESKLITTREAICPPWKLFLLSLATTPATHGFYTYPPRLNYHGRGQRIILQSKEAGNEHFYVDLIQRAGIPLPWEVQMIEDARPVLDLSARGSDQLSIPEPSGVPTAYAPDDESRWEYGHVWKDTERQLISRGILHNGTLDEPRTSNATSETVLSKAPQLYRLPTSHVIESSIFFAAQDNFNIRPLIDLDPSLLTYRARDLHYGMEYLSNMMTRGNITLAFQIIHDYCLASPPTALSIFRMGVDGGIDERRISRALANAGLASGKALEFTVGDAKKSLNEFKRVKNGKGSLG